VPAGHDISEGADTFFRVRALEFDAASNSTTTGVEITGLELKSVGPGIYVVEYFLVYQSGATTTGVKFGVNHTGTSTLAATCQVATTGTTAVTAVHDQATTTTPTIMGSNATRSKTTTSPDLGPWTDIDTANADMQVYIYVSLVVTAIGDMELWHASETAAASTVKAGSVVRLTKGA
jgi:hypothetical protein